MAQMQEMPYACKGQALDVHARRALEPIFSAVCQERQLNMIEAAN